jgi:hypothetical protein
VGEKLVFSTEKVLKKCFAATTRLNNCRFYASSVLLHDNKTRAERFIVGGGFFSDVLTGKDKDLQESNSL